jgi:NAD(P)-dependent dehydrogenase (short-subunit alcohol dehydrogenase family)
VESFKDRVAVVTGGGSGIGRALTLALAREGARVVVADLDVPAGEAAAKEVDGTFVECDVTSEEQVHALFDKAVDVYGGLDIAFNNAGVEGKFGPLTTEQTVEHYDYVCDINIRGVLLSMKHEIAAMLRSGGGAIVNNASIGGHIGFQGSSVYVASKWAVLGLTKTAALEFARQGVRVNSISPGTVQTEMFDRAFGEGETEMKKTLATQNPIGRIGTPEEIASAVLWLSSPGAGFTTGQDIIVDGGYTAQ